MDARVKRIKTPKACEIFARNAIEHGRPDLATEANLRMVQLRAEEHDATSAAEKEALQAIYAHEEVLSKKNRRRTPASRTWQMIKRHGIIESVERAVNRKTETQNYSMLMEMGLEEFAFEAVILRHPELFSDNAIEKSRQRISEWERDCAQKSSDEPDSKADSDTSPTTLKPITNQADSEQAFQTLRDHFRLAARVFRSHRVGSQGGGHSCNVYWHGSDGIWGLFEPQVAKGRYWIAFGMEDPEYKGMLTITVESNPPIQGVNRRCAGAFLTDEQGNTFIAHNGALGGGRKGIGKKAFYSYAQAKDWKNVTWPDGKCDKFLVISKLDSPRLSANIAEFVNDVARFKSQAVSGLGQEMDTHYS